MDRDVLRELAGQIAEIAALDVQKETERLYRAVNNLNMIRPVVLLDELPCDDWDARFAPENILTEKGILR